MGFPRESLSGDPTDRLSTPFAAPSWGSACSYPVAAAIPSMDWLAYESALLSVRVRATVYRVLLEWWAHTRLTRPGILVFTVRAARRRCRLQWVTISLALRCWFRITKGRDLPTIYVGSPGGVPRGDPRGRSPRRIPRGPGWILG